MTSFFEMLRAKAKLRSLKKVQKSKPRSLKKVQKSKLRSLKKAPKAKLRSLKKAPKTTQDLSFVKDLHAKAKIKSNQYKNKLREKFMKAFKEDQKWDVEDVIKRKRHKAYSDPEVAYKLFLSFFENKDILVHIDPAYLSNIFEDRRLKNIFEITQKHERKNPGYFRQRNNAERKIFNAPRDLSDKLKPKYGCINYFDAFKGCASSYGKVFFKLNKDKLKHRITVTPEDSLDSMHNAIGFVGSLDHMYHTLYNIKDNYFNEIVTNVRLFSPETKFSDSERYVEAQIWGELSLDDIEEIHYSEPNIKDPRMNVMKKLCKKHKCKLVPFDTKKQKAEEREIQKEKWAIYDAEQEAKKAKKGGAKKKVTVVELKKLCKKKGIKGYSKLNKRQLMKLVYK